MKSKDHWSPSKYIYRKNKLIATRDLNEVSISSRLMADLVAKQYDNNLALHAKGKLLDLGCGKSPLYGAYKELVHENTCVDWSGTLHKSKHLDFECDLTKPLNFANGEFDTIILSDVLEHIPEPELLWREMTRVLSSGGTILMNVPFYYWIHEKPYDYYRYTEFALRRFVKLCDLELIHITPLGGAPEILTDIFSKNVAHLPIVGKGMAAFSQWLTMQFIETKFGSKVSSTSAANFPLGYFLVARKPAPLTRIDTAPAHSKNKKN